MYFRTNWYHILACHWPCHRQRSAFFNSMRPSDAYMRQSTNQNWFRQWFVAWPAPSHYLNQCWKIANWTLGNKLQWYFNHNWNILIQENALENVVCEIESILSRPQRVKDDGLVAERREAITTEARYMCVLIPRNVIYAISLHSQYTDHVMFMRIITFLWPQHSLRIAPSRHIVDQYWMTISQVYGYSSIGW